VQKQKSEEFKKRLEKAIKKKEVNGEEGVRKDKKLPWLKNELMCRVSVEMTTSSAFGGYERRRTQQGMDFGQQ
jgi:hypothetical protein